MKLFDTDVAIEQSHGQADGHAVIGCLAGLRPILLRFGYATPYGSGIGLNDDFTNHPDLPFDLWMQIHAGFRRGLEFTLQGKTFEPHFREEIAPWIEINADTCLFGLNVGSQPFDAARHSGETRRSKPGGE